MVLLIDLMVELQVNPSI